MQNPAIKVNILLVIQLLELELKPFCTSFLRCPFFAHNTNTFHIIIFASLTPSQEEKPLRILRNYKIFEALARMLAYTKFLWKKDTAFVEQHRGFNPIMKEIVKKEISGYILESFTQILMDNPM